MYGTHIIVGLKMGGKDVIYLKQQYSSSLKPVDLQIRLKDVADKRFTDNVGQNTMHSEQACQDNKVCDGSICLLVISDYYMHFHNSLTVQKQKNCILHVCVLDSSWSYDTPLKYLPCILRVLLLMHYDSYMHVPVSLSTCDCIIYQYTPKLLKFPLNAFLVNTR